MIQHKQTSLHYCVLTPKEVFQYPNSGICTCCDSVQFANELLEHLFRFWTDSLYLPISSQCSDLVENLLSFDEVYSCTIPHFLRLVTKVTLA